MNFPIGDAMAWNVMRVRAVRLYISPKTNTASACINAVMCQF